MNIKELVRQARPYAAAVSSEGMQNCFAEAERLLAGEVTFQYFRDFIDQFLPFPQMNNRNDWIVKSVIRAVECNWRLENGWYVTGVARRHARGIIHQAEKELTSRIK